MEWTYNWTFTQSMSGFRQTTRRTLHKIRRKYEKVFHGNCLVLLYHRVTHLDTDPQLLSVTPDHFDAHLSLLRKQYHVLTVEEFSEHINRRIKFPPNAVLLTFDDGYADNYLEALPILEQHGMQGLFYIATGTLGTDKEFWWDAVERIVLLSREQPLEKEFVLHNIRHDLTQMSAERRRKLYDELLPALRRMSSAERDQKIAGLASLFGAEINRATHRPMTFEELKKMHQSKSAFIGAHTHLHPSLAALSYEEQYREIATSKKILEETLGNPIMHFSYPFGTVLDYNSDTLRIVKELNFDLVAANYPEPVSCVSNRFTFPRFLVRDWNKEEFSKQMNSFSS